MVWPKSTSRRCSNSSKPRPQARLRRSSRSKSGLAPAPMKICVLGAGAWGTALAINAARPPCGHAVGARCGPGPGHGGGARQRALSAGHCLPRRTAGRRRTCARRPWKAPNWSSSRRRWRRCANNSAWCATCACPVAWLAKGVEPPRPGSAELGLLAHEIQAPRGAGTEGRRAERTELRAGSGAGPADGAGRGQSPSRRCASRWSRPFTAPRCASMPTTTSSASRSAARSRTCWRSPPACADGLGLGLNARAALITRGLAEMTRFGLALGARSRDLHGPVGARRPGADGHRRPVAQPQGRPVAGPGPHLVAGGRFAGPCGRRRLLRAHRGAAARATWASRCPFPTAWWPCWMAG